MLYELDGKPALALYKAYLADRAAGLPGTGMLFPLDICAADTPEQRAWLAPQWASTKARSP